MLNLSPFTKKITSIEEKESKTPGYHFIDLYKIIQHEFEYDADYNEEDKNPFCEYVFYQLCRDNECQQVIETDHEYFRLIDFD